MSREGRATIAGVSIGGSQALYIGPNHPQKFGSVASFSGALIMYGGSHQELLPLIGGEAPRLLSMSVGTADFLLPVNRQFTSWLGERALAVDLDEVAGGHDWRT